jgi:hypothetical protein
MLLHQEKNIPVRETLFYKLEKLFYTCTHLRLQSLVTYMLAFLALFLLSHVPAFLG